MYAWRGGSRCTCSLEGGLGFGAATVGGPFGIGLAGTVDGSTSGVSGANVDAGDGGGSAEANPGSTIGKSEMLKCCTTGPLGTEYFSTGGGTFVTVTGGLLRRTFGLAVGGAFSKELLLVCKVALPRMGLN